MTKSTNRDQYWATLSKEEVATELQKKMEDWYAHISTSGVFRRMRKCYLAYYGFSSAGQGHTASEVAYGGDQGELSLFKVNQLRNIVQHMLVMTTSTRPAMEARSVNTDYKSLSQTILANSILDFYMRERKLERYFRSAVEHALVYGEGFIRLTWDTSIGDEYMIDNEGKTIYTGDIRFSVHNPLDVIRDVFQPDNNEHDWMIVRSFKNRYELAAKYPDLKDEILQIGSKEDIDLEYKLMNFNLTTSSDLIPVYEFYHKRSEALPNGRMVAFLTSDAVMYDGDLPYRDIPIYRIAPSDQMQTTFGYTSAFDLLALQDITDALHSTIVTNQSTFGVQNIVAPQGHNLSVSQLGGLNFIEYDPASGKPEPLNLTFTPPEIFNYLGSIEKMMETISGVNSVARGNPEANLRSGNSLALVQSMAIQFNNGLQQSYAQLIEDVGTAVIKTLKDFASVERTAVLVGKNNRTYMKSFQGRDLKDVDRVVVDMGNPLSKTTAGKLEMANNLLQMGLIKSPDQYMTVMKTGNLDIMLEGPTTEMVYIKQENEWLSEGKEAPVLITDNHIQHIMEHKAVLSTIEARMNPDVMRAVRIHIEEHVNSMKNADPDLLSMLGIQPLQPGRTQMDNLDPAQATTRRETEMQQAPMQPMQAPMQPMQAPGMAPDMTAAQPPNMEQIQAAEAQAMLQSPIGLGAEELPNQPNFPKNALTGLPWNPQSGGL
jgi:hypothetical protein